MFLVRFQWIRIYSENTRIKALLMFTFCFIYSATSDSVPKLVVTENINSLS